MTRYNRWQGAVVGALVVLLLAVVTGNQALLLLAAVALGMTAVGSVSSSPDGTVRVERSLSDEEPEPGTTVTVTLTVHNPADRALPDVRVEDAVPDGLAVVRGTPALATSLGPGRSASHEYVVAPPRGEFRFGDPTVRLRNLPATAAAEPVPEVDGVESFTCETLLDGLPLRDQTIHYVGETPTDDGGVGVEFYSTREYRPGDPINQIDWNRLARTGTLSTVEYREERAVTVVFLVDDRAGAHVRSPVEGPDSFDLTLYAASRGVDASLSEGNRTGVATVSGDWLPPGDDEYTRHEAEELLTDVEPIPTTAASGETTVDGGDVGRAAPDGGSEADGGDAESDGSTDADGGHADTDGPADDAAATGSGTGAFSRLVERLPPNAQVVVCSPVTDSDVVDGVERLVAHGHRVSVLSPDMATSIVGDADLPVGAQLAAVARATRLRRLRGLDVAVADWQLDEPIGIELDRLRQRW